MGFGLSILLAMAAAQAPDDLRAQEQAIRARMADNPDYECLSLDRVSCAVELAEVLEKQGRAGEGIDEIAKAMAALQEEGAMGNEARGVLRFGADAIAAIRERQSGPSDALVRQRWAIAIDRQRRTIAVDGGGAEMMTARGEASYLDTTAAMLLALARGAEAVELARASYRTATAFRFERGAGDMQAQDIARFKVQRSRSMALVRAAFVAAQEPFAPEPEWRAADAVLEAGDWAAAEAAYRALMARTGAPLIATAQQVRAIRGLARALAAQGGAKLAEGIAMQRALLDRLVVQCWRGDAMLVALGAEHQAALRAAGQVQAAARVEGLLERYRLGGPPPRF
ncbi:hypothetical protein [Sphingomonas sp.]|uniref:hypothetical protein n=1 Tax=Sphingomonas sp. TaxID=28214 RepID=UPI003F70031A